MWFLWLTGWVLFSMGIRGVVLKCIQIEIHKLVESWGDGRLGITSRIMFWCLASGNYLNSLSFSIDNNGLWYLKLCLKQFYDLGLMFKAYLMR